MNIAIEHRKCEIFTTREANKNGVFIKNVKGRMIIGRLMKIY